MYKLSIESIKEECNLVDNSKEQIFINETLENETWKEIKWLTSINDSFDIWLENKLLWNENIFAKSNDIVDVHLVDWDILSNLNQSISDFLDDYKIYLKETNSDFYSKLVEETTIDHDGNEITKLDLLKRDLLQPEKNALVELQRVINKETEEVFATNYLSEVEIKEKELSPEEKKQRISKYIAKINENINSLKDSTPDEKEEFVEYIEWIVPHVDSLLTSLDENHDVSGLRSSLDDTLSDYMNYLQEDMSNIPQFLYTLSFIKDPNDLLINLESFLKNEKVVYMTSFEMKKLSEIIDNMDINRIEPENYELFVLSLTDIFSNDKRYDYDKNDNIASNENIHLVNKQRYKVTDNSDIVPDITAKFQLIAYERQLDAETHWFPTSLINEVYWKFWENELNKFHSSDNENDKKEYIANIIDLQKNYRSIMSINETNYDVWNGIVDWDLKINYDLNSWLDIEVLQKLISDLWITKQIEEKILPEVIENPLWDKTTDQYFAEKIQENDFWTKMILVRLWLSDLIWSIKKFDELSVDQRIQLVAFDEAYDDNKLDFTINEDKEIIQKWMNDFLTDYEDNLFDIAEDISNKYTWNAEDYGLTWTDAELVNLLYAWLEEKWKRQELYQDTNPDPYVSEVWIWRFWLKLLWSLIALGATFGIGFWLGFKKWSWLFSPTIEYDTEWEPKLSNITDVSKILAVTTDYEHEWSTLVEAREVKWSWIEQKLQKFWNWFQNKEVQVQVKGKIGATFDLTELEDEDVWLDNEWYVNVNLPELEYFFINPEFYVVARHSELIELDIEEFKNAETALVQKLENDAMELATEDNEMKLKALTWFEKSLDAIFGNLSKNYKWCKLRMEMDWKIYSNWKITDAEIEGVNKWLKINKDNKDENESDTDELHFY